MPGEPLSKPQMEWNFTGKLNVEQEPCTNKFRRRQCRGSLLASLKWNVTLEESLTRNRTLHEHVLEATMPGEPLSKPQMERDFVGKLNAEQDLTRTRFGGDNAEGAS